mmetsp:Transcript_16527/g.57884  ORF Transcript_16527/g.57884 Transcript_16527/m.57884 type:complete len:244 (-) Transcript_16527:409-1140(-)
MLEPGPARQRRQLARAIHEFQSALGSLEQRRHDCLVLDGAECASAVHHPATLGEAFRTGAGDTQLQVVEGRGFVGPPTGEELWCLPDGAVATAGHIAENAVKLMPQVWQRQRIVVQHEACWVPRPQHVVRQHAAPPAVQFVGHHGPGPQHCRGICQRPSGSAGSRGNGRGDGRGGGGDIEQLKGLHTRRGTDIQNAEPWSAVEKQGRDHGASLLAGDGPQLSARLEEVVQALWAWRPPEHSLW